MIRKYILLAFLIIPSSGCAQTDLEVKSDSAVTAQIPQQQQGGIHVFADSLKSGSIWRTPVLWKYSQESPP